MPGTRLAMQCTRRLAGGHAGRDRRHASGANCGVALSPPFSQVGYDCQLTMDETVTVCVLVFPGNDKSSSFPGFGRERRLRSFHRINPPQLGKSGYLQRSDRPLRLGRISSSWRSMHPPAGSEPAICGRWITPLPEGPAGQASFEPHAAWGLVLTTLNEQVRAACPRNRVVG